MKKLLKRINNYFLVLLILFGWIFFPANVYAVSEANKTLGDLKNELSAMQKKKAANDAAQKKTKSEIAAAQNKMGEANKSIENATVQIELLTGEIDKTNAEIESLKEETSKLLILYEKLQDENMYIDYITGSSTMFDLLTRINAVKEITNYNNQRLDNLELLIKNTEKMNKRLGEYQDTLSKKIVEYENIIDDLGDDLALLIEGAPTIEDNIQALKASIKSYEAMGCKDTDLLSVCVNISDNAGWLRPVTKGKITSAFGTRFHPTKKVWQMHNGIDIGVSEGTKAYATANGVVGAVVTSGSSLSCGGKKVYLNVYVNGEKYTVVYMHLLDIYVKVGDKVTTQTVIGLTGGGKQTMNYDKCTTGAHLHYGVSKGVHYNGSNSSKLNAGYINPPGFPAVGSWFYSR